MTLAEAQSSSEAARHGGDGGDRAEPRPPAGEARLYRPISVLLALAPLLLITGLLYAAFFIKPKVSTAAFAVPAVQRGEFMYGISAAAPSLLWAAGTGGKIWLSRDEAKSWTVQATPTRLNLQDIVAWNPQQAVAVGDEGVVLRTGDGGQSWQAVEVVMSKLSNKLLRLRLFEDGSAWAVGEGGSVLSTRDQGQHWQRRHADVDQAWNDIHQQAGRIWLVGEFGRIEMSKDAGAHWSSVDSPVRTSLMAIGFRDAEHGVAVGVEGVILVTHDGGARWRELPRLTREHLFDLLWDGKQWLAVGDKGVLLKADAAAKDWQFGHVAAGDRSWRTKLISSGGKLVFTGAAVSVLPQ